VAIGVLGIPHY